MAKRSSMRDAARRRADRKSRETSSMIELPEGMEFIKLKKRMRLSVVPYKVSVKNHKEGIKTGDYWYEKTYGVHRNIGPEEKGVICPKVTSGKPCPICEEHRKMRKDPDADDDATRALKPQEKQLMCAIDLDDNTKKVGMIDAPYWTFGRHIDNEIEEGDEELAGFADVEGGKIVKVRCKQSKFAGNAFFEVDRIDFVPRKDLSPAVLKQAVDLDKLLRVPSYDEVKALFEGQDEPDDEEEDETRKKTGKKNPSRKHDLEDEEDEEEDEDDSADVFDEEEEEEEEESEEEEEEEEESEEEEEEEEEEESEEEEPRRKKKTSRR